MYHVSSISDTQHDANAAVNATQVAQNVKTANFLCQEYRIGTVRKANKLRTVLEKSIKQLNSVSISVRVSIRLSAIKRFSFVKYRFNKELFPPPQSVEATSGECLRGRQAWRKVMAVYRCRMT